MSHPSVHLWQSGVNQPSVSVSISISVSLAVSVHFAIESGVLDLSRISGLGN